MKTLNGYKREKALAAVLDKGYSRFPDEEHGYNVHLQRIREELETEMIPAVRDIYHGDPNELTENDYVKAMKEIADVSNFCDFIADRAMVQFVMNIKHETEAKVMRRVDTTTKKLITNMINSYKKFYNKDELPHGTTKDQIKFALVTLEHLFSTNYMVWPGEAEQ